MSTPSRPLDRRERETFEYAPTGDRTPASFPPVDRIVAVAPART